MKTEARVLPKDAYAWYQYTGSSVTVGSPREVTLKKGDKFGARKSTSGKQIRLVMEAEGINKVYTIPYDQAKAIGKSCKLVKKAKPVKASDRMTEQVAMALSQALRKLDPGVEKVKQTDSPRGMVYAFKLTKASSLANITKSIADLDTSASNVSKDTVRFNFGTKVGVQYEEEFLVFFNEQDPESRLVQITHLK